MLASFLLQHIRLLTELINGTNLANIEKEHKIRTSATYNTSLDTCGTTTIRGPAEYCMRFSLG